MASEKNRHRNRPAVRYAVVGMGHIAQVAVLPAFKESKNSRLVALVSGDDKKRRILSRRYGVKHVYDYDHFDDCLRNEEVDAVYIALPNEMHEEYSIRALEAGVHVLCEKPLAVTSEEGMRILRVAEQADAKFMVAYRLHFDPTNLRAVKIANSGKIGEPAYFTSEFGYQLKEKNIRARPQEGGSPLHDLGVYCINAARYLFKSEPTEVFAMGVCPSDSPPNIYQTVMATLRFPADRLASFTCSFASAPISNFRIFGTKGARTFSSSWPYRFTDH